MLQTLVAVLDIVILILRTGLHMWCLLDLLATVYDSLSIIYDLQMSSAERRKQSEAKG